jgi:hypothetical protein
LTAVEGAGTPLAYERRTTYEVMLDPCQQTKNLLARRCEQPPGCP